MNVMILFSTKMLKAAAGNYNKYCGQYYNMLSKILKYVCDMSALFVYVRCLCIRKNNKIHIS
jgi:hypothetical protein